MDSADLSLTRRAAWRYAAVFFIAIAGVVNAAEPAKKRDDPIVGSWKWANDQVVECRRDNSVVVTPSGKKGTWNLTSTPSAERKYELKWEGGRKDELVMSVDEKKLSGSDADGKKFESDRVVAEKRD